MCENRRARLESLEARQLFSAGSLDPTFGGTGVIESVVAGGVVYESSVAVQPDQKIVTAALVFNPNAPDGNRAYVELTRYNPDGSLDANFGTAGNADSLLTEPIRAISDEAIAPDGKIVIAGQYATQTQSLYGGFIARFNANGTLDSTFGNGGFLDGAAGTGIGGNVRAVSVELDGEIVAAVAPAPFGAHSAITSRLEQL